jgi:transcriptional regulator
LLGRTSFTLFIFNHDRPMYVPPSFRVDDPQKLSAFIDANSFGTLVTCQSGLPRATHLPMRPVTRDGVCTRLVAHMARANPQWQDFAAGSEALAIFTGPHAYVSPAWYVESPAVPTWNYAAVHVYGIPRVIDDHDRIVEMLAEMISHYEAASQRPWDGVIPDEYRDRLIRAIVAFEIEVTRVEGKYKLGQNRGEGDIEGVHRALDGSNDPGSRSLAALMRSEGLIP